MAAREEGSRGLDGQVKGNGKCRLVVTKPSKDIKCSIRNIVNNFVIDI